MTTTSVSPESVGVHVGSVFVASWGWDQTQPTFFQVVGLTPKGVKVRYIGEKQVDESHVLPVVDNFVDNWRANKEEDRKKPLTKRLRSYTLFDKTTVSFNWTSYADAYLYDLDEMKPCYKTPSWMGH